MQFVIEKSRTPIEGIRYHARVYSDDGKLIFWSKPYKSEAKAIQRCEELQKGAAAAVIVPTPSA
jgi:uncharacterized protein YegP (UPF0339 family)